MARNRKPLAVAEVSGATIKNPGRYRGRGRPARVRGIGDPYQSMSDAERDYWREIAEACPWLNGAHRTLLRMTCLVAARMDSPDGIGVNASRLLVSLLSKLGATPVDESRILNAAPNEEDPADEFFVQGKPH